MLPSNYECDGQMDIFDFLLPVADKSSEGETKAFCWDNDINEIHQRIVSLASKYGLNIAKSEFRIWDHVPQYGYRMTVDLRMKRTDMTEALNNDLAEIEDFAKGRKVEISPTMPQFFRTDEFASMYIFSTFMDKERQKRK